MLEVEMRHKHADLIHAWAEGAEIEICNFGQWQPSLHPSFAVSCAYRIKPTPKPDRVINYEMSRNGSVWVNTVGANIKLTFDGETGQLKSAEVIK